MESPRLKLDLRLLVSGLVALMMASDCRSSPPLLPGADPHAALMDGSVWIFPTWSEERRRQKFFAFSSTNLVDWQRHGPLLDLSEVPWVAEDRQPWHGAWAPCVLHRDRRWYLYYSVGPQNPTPSRLGVAVADQPGGPYRDSGRPLLTGGNGFEAIDPMVFEDPKSGTTYLYVGGSAGAKLRVFELAPDLIRFTREIPVETPPKFTEGAYMHWHRDRYYLSYSHGGWQHSSYSVHYATAPSPMGPWTYQGPILTSDATRKGPGHHSFLHFPGTDDWRIVYHRWENQTGDGPYKGSRQICIDQVEYTPDGRILPIRMSDQPPPRPPGPVPTLLEGK